MTTQPRPHRPALRDPNLIEAMGAGSDPVAALHAAHESAAVLLHAGQAAHDPQVTQRLVELVDEIGIATLAELWAARPARSLPGALWRLYVLREWMTKDPNAAAREYAAGIRFTEVSHVVAGVDPTGPEEIKQVADAILRGVFTGDFAVALDRAAAFCRVVVAGRADLAQQPSDVQQAVKLQDMATDLAACAELWRADRLD